MAGLATMVRGVEAGNDESEMKKKLSEDESWTLDSLLKTVFLVFACSFRSFRKIRETPLGNSLVF